MPYELKENPESVQLSISASSREELFRVALTGVLEATYGAHPPEGTAEGLFVPLQAAGADDNDLLLALAEEALRAVQEEPGTLRPPRWLSFDSNRVTGNLPVQVPKTAARPLGVSSAEVESDSVAWTARLDFLRL